MRSAARPGVASAHFAPLGPRAERGPRAHRRARTPPTTALLLERAARPTATGARASSHAGRACARADDPGAAGRQSAAGTARSLEAPRGAGGFGYDPLVFIPALGTTVAELDAAAKNAAQPPRARRAADAGADARRLEPRLSMKTSPSDGRAPIVAAAARPLGDVAERLAAFMRPGALTLAALPPLSLYVHLPWCLKKCPYCDFNSHAWPRRRSTTLPRARATSTRSCADLEASLPFVWGRRVHSVFIGGGTPSLFAPAAIERLLAAIRARLPLEPGCEITLEANPGTFERERFRGYRAAGVTRLSIGVQSFDDAKLRRARPRPRRGAGARRDRRGAGGVRHLQHRPDVRAARPDARRVAKPISTAALAFEPPHLSIYHLTIEPNTLLREAPAARCPTTTSPSAMLDRIVAASRPSAGLRRYEVSAFARPGHRCAPQPQLLGVRRLPRHRRRRARQAQLPAPRRAPGALSRSGAYMAGAEPAPAIAPDDRGRARRDLPFEFMLNALRLQRGLRARPLRRAHRAAASAIARPLAEAERRGLRRARPASRSGRRSAASTSSTDLLSSCSCPRVPERGAGATHGRQRRCIRLTCQAWAPEASRKRTLLLD